MKLYHSDCLEVLKTLPENSVDSLVTDPPAGISFMGKEWDSNKGGRDEWIAWLTQVLKECHRVIKPGGHALVWALPRTSHWTATAIEDAGFEIRDIVMHIFGQGFPHGHNIYKNIGEKLEKCLLLNNVRHVVQISQPIQVVSKEGKDAFVLALAEIRPEGEKVLLMEIGKEGNSKEVMGISLSGLEMENINLSTTLSWKELLGENLNDMKKFIIRMNNETTIDQKILSWLQNLNISLNIIHAKEIIIDGLKYPVYYVIKLFQEKKAKLENIPVLTVLGNATWTQYKGFNVALKPAAEHWILARKPISEKSITDNVLKWGTAAINIDECRVETHGKKWGKPRGGIWATNTAAQAELVDNTLGRFPANVIISRNPKYILEGNLSEEHKKEIVDWLYQNAKHELYSL